MFRSRSFNKVLFTLIVSLSMTVGFSCSQGGQLVYTEAVESETLKEETNGKKKALIWTAPMSERTSADSYVTNEGKISFSEKLRIPTSLDDAVYPSMPELGSMDVSGISAVIMSNLEQFLLKLKNSQVKYDDPVFKNKSVGIVFLYELSFYPEFTSWYTGAPFIDMDKESTRGSVYEIPVLFVGKSNRFKAWIYLDAEDAAAGRFKIRQIVLGEIFR